MALKNKEYKPDLTGQIFKNTDGVEFPQNQRFNIETAKGGHMEKISTGLITEEIAAKILSNNKWGKSGRPVQRPSLLNVEPEK